MKATLELKDKQYNIFFFKNVNQLCRTIIEHEIPSIKGLVVSLGSKNFLDSAGAKPKVTSCVKG